MRLSTTFLLLSIATIAFGRGDNLLPANDDNTSAALVATDALGRTLPTAEQCPIKKDGKPRTVGIFYITWHTQGLHDGGNYRADVSRVLNADPNARKEWDNKEWSGPSYHWGEPEYGYFLSQDKYVIRHDISMLADAGVDVLIMDVTNAVCYWDEWEVLFTTMEEMKAEGNRVPKFCFWAFNGNVISVVEGLYERFYKTPRFSDLWFYWDGKPLLLYNDTPSVDANPNGGEKNLKDYSPEVRKFFTLRGMWWGYWEWAGKRYVGTEDHWSFGFDLGDKRVASLTPTELCAKHNGRLEQMAVTPAQHPISIIGKCWRRETGEPELNDHDMPSRAYIPYLNEERDMPTQYGIYFQDRWDEALQADPDFIYLNDWNEWSAGRYRQGKDPSGQADLHIDFLGRKDNPFYFVDQYNAEFNRTIAPMKGGWTDSYYMQMVQNIRRYKGVAPVPTNYGKQRINIDGRFDDWSDTLMVSYRDTHGDVIHRDHDGYGNFHYTDSTGRNDIILTKVASSKKELSFYAKTAKPLTPSSDASWMLLLIDADCNAKTGSDGYDYIVNYNVINGRHTTIMRYNEATQTFCDPQIIPYATNANELEISIPRKLMPMLTNPDSFYFKWADNPTALDIISISTSGDTAPNRRFAYHYKHSAKL